MDADKIKEAIRAAAPRARLERLREFWGDCPPAVVASQLEALERILAANDGKATHKAELLLADLSHAATLVEWNTDPDTLRGEKQAAGDRKGGERSAAEKKAQKAARAQEAAARFDRLAHVPERNRAAVIAEAMGCTARTVREYLRTTGRKAEG